MTVGIIAKLTVREGKASEFESLLTHLAEQVRANEPGNILYQLTRSRAEANVYKVVELYADKAAMDHHLSAEHFKAASARFPEVLAGRPDVEFIDGVG